MIEVPLLDFRDSVELFLVHFDQGELDIPFSKVEKIVVSERD